MMMKWAKTKAKKKFFGYDLIFQALTKWLVLFDHLDRCVCVCVSVFGFFRISLLFLHTMNECVPIRLKETNYERLFWYSFLFGGVPFQLSGQKMIFAVRLLDVNRWWISFWRLLFVDQRPSFESDHLIINHIHMLKSKTSETNS